MDVFDVVIIGGGINGCGCAADAALRGLSVLLCEKDDIASKTSSSSTKLIHGGLRYLEYYDFSLVKKALDERQKLLELAPHLVHALPIVLPQQKAMRPLWMLRAGLFLYDNLSRKNKLPKAKLIHRRQQPQYFNPLTCELNDGFLFYDGATDDARLTLANAKQARDHGARILTRTSLVQAEAVDNQWLLTLQPAHAEPFQVQAKTIINAAGPWVEPVNNLLHIPMNHTMSLVKGSHIVVHKLYEGNHAYLLQHTDNRIVFVIPYHGYTMIGTTDVAFTGVLEDISISPAEINYLFELVNTYFSKQLVKGDIINSWSGVRPLIAETGKALTKISRDYAYHFTSTPAPAITIYGGKVTTYRRLALRAIDELNVIFPKLPDSKTAITPLPGAVREGRSFKEYQQYAREKYHWLDPELLERYLQNYGTDAEQFLAACMEMSDLGIYFTHSLYQVEVDYLMDEEWAISCDDVLWRRSKLGLSMDMVSQSTLANYLHKRALARAYEDEFLSTER